MIKLSKEVIGKIGREKDEEILKKVLEYYEFLKWQKEGQIDISNVIFNEDEEDPEIEIEWFL